MEQVTGIGGFFFTARDATALGHWYAEHLGVREVPSSYDDEVWEQEAGPTIFAPSAAEPGQSHMGPTGWGLNFRVRDLDAMVGQLTAAGVDVDVDPEQYPNGRFAQLHDPEGNAIQLWEPVT